MPLLVSWSSDSAGVMYRARRPCDGVAGYHSETISSRAVTPATQGSGREVSVSHKDVVPTGHGPVGSGRHGVCPGPASASSAPAEAPMPPSSPAVLALIKWPWPVGANLMKVGTNDWLSSISRYTSDGHAPTGTPDSAFGRCGNENQRTGSALLTGVRG